LPEQYSQIASVKIDTKTSTQNSTQNSTQTQNPDLSSISENIAGGVGFALGTKWGYLPIFPFFFSGRGALSPEYRLISSKS
jgi:hypothetical protein